MWTIAVPAGQSISFKFEKKFDLEYHHRCGYDRVHIFSGTIDGETQRQGRFCGPKTASNKPYDGSRRHVETNGVMPVWDTAFDIQSNTAIVGFDSDQTFVGVGFKLVWNSHPANGPVDFTNVFDAHGWLADSAKTLFNSVMFRTDKGIFANIINKYIIKNIKHIIYFLDKKKFKKQLDGKITTSSRTALQNNPGSGAGYKKRKCAKSQQISVSIALVEKCHALQTKINQQDADFSDAMVSIKIVHYITYGAFLITVAISIFDNETFYNENSQNGTF